MTEFEILDLVGAVQSDQIAVITQLISLHLAIVVGIFYFLYRSGIVMKLGIALLYTLGYAMIIGLIVNTSGQLGAARADLLAIKQANGRLSASGEMLLVQTDISPANWVSLVSNVVFIVLWLGTIGFLFFWKRPGDR